MKRLGFAAGLAAVGLAGFFLGSIHYHQAPEPKTLTSGKVLYYIDPMNPAHISDKPGRAPCGMEMEPVYAAAGAGSVGNSPVPGAVILSARRQQLIGVEVKKVERVGGKRVLRTVGKVVPDETRIYRIAAPVDGWVRSVSAVVTGNQVKEDEVLATFYNRDFLTAQQTYLYALNTMDRFQETESEDQLKLTRAQIRAAEENLEFLGMGPTQIHEIARTRELARNVEIRAPASGLVTFRNAFAGLRFERGTELFKIVQLEHVWVMADVHFEQPEFQPGDRARVTPVGGRRAYDAEVSRQPPQFDPETRTLRVRLEVDNSGNLLRPEMYVDVELAVNYPPAIVIPLEAVLETGRRTAVFVESSPGCFEPRAVELGWQADEQVEVREGLTTGEQIVISGNFLLDSESRMKLAATVRQEPAAELPAPVNKVEAIDPDLPAKPQPASDDSAMDPVCGMAVGKAEAQSAGQVCTNNGRTYFFCGASCKAAFEKSSSKYSDGSGDVTPAKTFVPSMSPRARKVKTPRD